MESHGFYRPEATRYIEKDETSSFMFLLLVAKVISVGHALDYN